MRFPTLSDLWRRRPWGDDPPPDDSPPSRLEDDRFLAASILFELLNDFELWVFRRVERVEILDTATLHRHISVDTRVPIELPSEIVVGTDSLAVTPLGFLSKEVLTRFSLRADDGRALPMLTKGQNGALAHDVLIAAAETRVNELHDEVAEALRSVATEQPSPAKDAIKDWKRAARDDAHPHHAAFKSLTEDDGFMTVAETLATDFVMCVDEPCKPGTRRLFKFSYESEWGKPKPFREGFRDACGWRWMPVDFEAPQAHLAASYHLEVSSGTDVDIGAARIKFTRGESGNPDADPPRPPVIDQPLGNRAHLYCPDLQAGVRADATVFLRARTSALPAWAFGVSLLLTLLLAGGGVALDDITAGENSQVAAALILLVPTFVAASLVQPGEHRLVTALLWGVRVLIAGTIVSTMVAVGVLAGAAECIQTELWWGATGVAALFTVGLATTLNTAIKTPG